MEKLELNNINSDIQKIETTNSSNEYFNKAKEFNQQSDEQGQLDKTKAENILLESMGMKEYFNKKEYIVKKGDGFLKIIQGLLGRDITKNINGELLIYLSQTLDLVYKNSGNKLIEGDSIKIINGSLIMKDNFSVKLPFVDIKYENINTYQGGKYLNNKQAIADSTSVNLNKKYIKGLKNTNNHKLWVGKDEYEKNSDLVDNVLIVAGVTAGLGIVILGSPAIAFAGISYGAISTTLMCISLCKSLMDANHSYQKNGNISNKDTTKIAINLGASALDRWTMNNGKTTIRLAGTIIDEFSDQIGIYTGNKVEALY